MKEYPGTWIVCDIENTYGGVTPNACKGMYSTALTALALNKKIGINLGNYAACTDVPSWDINLPKDIYMFYLSK